MTKVKLTQKIVLVLLLSIIVIAMGLIVFQSHPRHRSRPRRQPRLLNLQRLVI